MSKLETPNGAEHGDMRSRRFDRTADPGYWIKIVDAMRSMPMKKHDRASHSTARGDRLCTVCVCTIIKRIGCI